ncbi:MAG: IS110 family transposase [Trueperaceae bacterium]
MKAQAKTQAHLPVVNPHAAGIDIGSREHWVAVGQGPKDVQVFGVLTSDHSAVIEFLHQHSIATVALESTGSYWQALYSDLQRAGFEVVLCSLRGIKNPNGKTDNKDCLWIQRLHSLGLLKGAFIPEASIELLRTLTRHRAHLVEQATACSNRLQKTLRLLNIRLELAVSDITGTSGLAIINAIVGGERCAATLAELAHASVRKTKQQIADTLLGNWREDHLFVLQDLLSEYKGIQERIVKVEQKAEDMLTEMCNQRTSKDLPKDLSRKKVMKGQYRIDLPSLSYRYFGVDLMKIDGVSHNTVMTLIAEVGHDINKFPSAKAFASWLRLAPGVRISGGKVISSRTPHTRNLLAQALRNAANTIAQRKDGYLKQFFSRIAYRKGRAAAITATARKLAVIIYSMVTKNQAFIPMGDRNYEQKVKQQAIKHINRTLNRLNLNLDDLQVSPG